MNIIINIFALIGFIAVVGGIFLILSERHARKKGW
jgi:hypothetical protein